MPHFLMDLMHKYFRLEIEGIENIPKQGPGIILPNHSGFAGFDAMILTHEIFKNRHRIPRVLTHHLWFKSKATAIPANKMGYVEATTSNGIKELKSNHLIVLFPEGEQGNFKPSSKAYQLQDFKRGFVRLSMQTKTTIIPTLILGAEETHINLKQFDFGDSMGGLTLPLPFNILPFPVKWKIIFLPPIDLPFDHASAHDQKWVHKKAEEIRLLMQEHLDQEIKKRPGLYKKTPSILKKLFQLPQKLKFPKPEK